MYYLVGITQNNVKNIIRLTAIEIEQQIEFGYLSPGFKYPSSDSNSA